MIKKIRAIINYHGINNQKQKFGEEADELKEAITEYEFYKKSSAFYNVHNLKVENGLKSHITEEVADVLHLLIQFIEYYGLRIDEIKQVLEFKINRTIDEMDGEQERLKQTKFVVDKIAEHLKEGGSYRKLIYDRLGFAPESGAYTELINGLAISNAFCDLEELAKIKNKNFTI